MSDEPGIRDWIELAASQMEGAAGRLRLLAENDAKAWVERSGAANDIAEIASALAEHARIVQLQANAIQHEFNPALTWCEPLPIHLEQIEHSSRTRLPFNRKERYFTGTVLPALVTSDGFGHLQRFLDLCGVDGFVSPGLDGDQNIQFFTEYSFKESRLADDHARFPYPLPGGETPDVIIAGHSWLIAIEAKMFHRPTRASLQEQIGKQRSVLDYMVRGMAPQGTTIYHVVLIPESLRQEVEGTHGPLDHVTTLTWEQVALAYRRVGPRFWWHQLDYALKNMHSLASDNSWGKYRDGTLTGNELLAGYKAQDPSVTQFGWMGRRGGLMGSDMKNKDLVDDAWRAKAYWVRRHPKDHINWFPVAQFLDAVEPGWNT